MFQLNYQEARISRSQIVTLKRGQNIKYLPHAFTEQAVAMLSSVLRSKRAVQVNIEIMRAFVRLRKIIASNKDLAKRLDELEKKYDAQFKSVFDAIRQLMAPSVFTRPALRLPRQPLFPASSTPDRISRGRIEVTPGSLHSPRRRILKT